MHRPTKKHLRLETLLRKKSYNNNNNYYYEPCVVQTLDQPPFFGYAILSSDALRVVNWTVQVKNVDLLAELHRILHIQTVSDVPAFILYGDHAENSRHVRIVHLVTADRVESIEVAFIQKNSHFPKFLQKMWLKRLADCATGVPAIATNANGQLPLLDVSNCYEYFHRIIVSNESNSQNIFQIARKMNKWLTQVPEFRKLLWKDSLVFDWLLREIQKHIEIYEKNRIDSRERKTINELLKCLNSFVDFGVDAAEDWNIIRILRAKLSTIIEDVLYTLVEKDEYFLKCCVDIFFTLSLTMVEGAQQDNILLQSCSSILLLNVGTSVASLLQLVKFVLLVMGYCVAYLKQEQLRPFEAIVVFKVLYAIERLAENDHLKNLMQLEFQDEFKYFNLSVQLSDEFEMSFKEHLITLLNRFKNKIF